MTLAELADAAGVTPRTVRYYIAQGLLPPPVGTGGGADYTEAHLAHLKAIKALQNQHLPLAEIRGRLSGEGAAAPVPTASNSALDYLDSVLGLGRAPPAAAPSPVPGPGSSAGGIGGLSQAIPGGAPAQAVAAGSRSTWERHQLAPDVELHVRRPLTRELQRKLDRVLTLSRQIFEE